MIETSTATSLTGILVIKMFDFVSVGCILNFKIIAVWLQNNFNIPFVRVLYIIKTMEMTGKPTGWKLKQCAVKEQFIYLL